jgi:uncharacterized repeat protein (TIGR01451 family)
MKSAIALFIGLLFCLPAVSQLDPRERYGTFLGGSQATCNDYSSNFLCDGQESTTTPASTNVTAVTVDNYGNTYVAGDTTAVDFPTTSGAYSRTVTYATLGYDAATVSSATFAAKFSANGVLLWSTFLGVAPGGPIRAIGVDLSGNVTIVGTAYYAPDCRCGASLTNPFIMKLNSTGSSRTYYNEVFGEQVCQDGFGYVVSPLTGAAIDSAGHVYLTGQNYPWLYYETQCLPPPTTGASQTGAGYVAEVNTNQTTNNGRVYIALTTDAPNALALDSSGHAYVAGKYVTKFDSVGAITFSKTYFPSFATGAVNAIAVSGAGDVLFTGNASPQGAFPATHSFGTITTGSDAFVARLNSTGALVYSDVIHDAHMTPLAIGRDSANEPFVTGSNSGYQYSVNRYSTAPSKGAFLLRLNSTGTQVWLDSTFGGDAGFGIAIDSSWNAYVVGTSNAGEYFPLTSNAYQSSFKNAASQGFLAKLIIEADVKMQPQIASPNPVAHGANLTYTLSAYNNGPDVSDGDTITDVLPAGTTFVSFSTTNGTCTHPNVGYGGTLKCTRTAVLNKGSYWGPVKLTVHVNAAAGTTLKNTASVAAKTQDVVSSNNSATVYVKVQ